MQLDYGSERISFVLYRRARKDLAITVYPDRTVEVVAPNDAAAPDVMDRVRRRAGWIIRQRDRFERYRPLPTEKQYVSGETFFYLGRQCRLRIATGPALRPKLDSGFLNVVVPQRHDRENVRRLVEGWYREHARRVLAARFAARQEAMARFQIPDAPLEIRKMTRRWGSCTPSGRVLLNLHLMRVPVFCIDYVITHELCHLRVLNHGRDFYSLMERAMPDWQVRKRKLDSRVW